MKKFILLFILITLPVFGSGIIDKRKQLYQQNNDNMKLIYNAINSENFEQVIKSAGAIETFANQMIDYFPVGSISRGSSENIWSDFEGFTKAAKLNSNAAKTLRIAAQDNKLDELNSLFSELSSTCKSCHRSYKN
ncbi:cytochrome c [SAR116 cluster bacterium]|nr:cytochrome c [SAR116 cluster bacterium]